MCVERARSIAIVTVIASACNYVSVDHVCGQSCAYMQTRTKKPRFKDNASKIWIEPDRYDQDKA